MTQSVKQIKLPFSEFNGMHCAKDSWIVLLHANRVPPHVGLLMNGVYNSLTIKGHELNISYEALLKTIAKKEIEAVFIKVAQHPVFSVSYQTDIFMEIIKAESPVKQNGATCLSPIKLFFREFYALPLIKDELLFDFIDRLNANKFLNYFSACNFSAVDGVLQLPFYNSDELNERIKNERQPFYKD